MRIKRQANTHIEKWKKRTASLAKHSQTKLKYVCWRNWWENGAAEQILNIDSTDWMSLLWLCVYRFFLLSVTIRYKRHFCVCVCDCVRVSECILLYHLFSALFLHSIVRSLIFPLWFHLNFDSIFRTPLRSDVLVGLRYLLSFDGVRNLDLFLFQRAYTQRHFYSL